MTLESVPRYDPDRVSREGEHAVVVGGSMAGLSAARVLADAFDRVTVLDRDPFPDRPGPRDGTPQSSHPHAMLEAGRATLEDLFPGFCEELLSAGGLMIDVSTDFRHYEEGDYLAQVPEQIPMYTATRGLFDHVVRRKTAELDGVELRGGCPLVDYRLDGAGRAVEGVSIRDEDGDETDLAADLVVDATGRTSRTPRWLADNGFPSPTVEEVEVDVTYSTVVVERPPDDRLTMLAPPSAPRTRGGFVIPVEGDRWQVLLQGIHGDDAPTEMATYREFAASLPVSGIERILNERAVVSEGIDHYPFPASRRHRYEDLDRFPAGLVVTGDAIASFNPVYGQGMSVAALDALSLHHALAEGLDPGLPLRFFERAAGPVDTAWSVAVGSDFEFADTEGPKPTGTDLLNRYQSRLLRRAHSDPDVADAFYRVLRMETEPTELFRPGVLGRVLLPSVGPLNRGERA